MEMRGILSGGMGMNTHLARGNGRVPLTSGNRRMPLNWGIYEHPLAGNGRYILAERLSGILVGIIP